MANFVIDFQCKTKDDFGMYFQTRSIKQLSILVAQK